MNGRVARGIGGVLLLALAACSESPSPMVVEGCGDLRSNSFPKLAGLKTEAGAYHEDLVTNLDLVGTRVTLLNRFGDQQDSDDVENGGTWNLELENAHFSAWQSCSLAISDFPDVDSAEYDESADALRDEIDAARYRP